MSDQSADRAHSSNRLLNAIYNYVPERVQEWIDDRETVRAQERSFNQDDRAQRIELNIAALEHTTSRAYEAAERQLASLTGAAIEGARAAQAETQDPRNTPSVSQEQRTAAWLTSAAQDRIKDNVVQFQQLHDRQLDGGMER